MIFIQSYSDKIYSALRDLGYNSSVVDMLYQHLGVLGYSGSLPDRLYTYLSATGRINLTHNEYVSQLDLGNFFGEVIVEAFWERLNFWKTNFWSDT
jgi:hypothetical protein